MDKRLLADAARLAGYHGDRVRTMLASGHDYTEDEIKRAVRRAARYARRVVRLQGAA